MSVLIFIIGWLVAGALIMALLLGLYGVPPSKTDYRGNLETNEGFWFPFVAGTVFWPLALVAAGTFFPARWLYRKASKGKVNG